MKQVELTKGLALEAVLKEAKRQDVVLTRRGRPVALVSEMDAEELYWHAREHDPAFLASLRRARRQVKKGHTVRHEDLKRQLGLE
jgi:PHD/YefM family antitoxin component YafN of YafNO toxin-antitoxin module